MLGNIHRDKKRKAFKIEDFMPKTQRQPKRKMNTQELVHVARQITAINGGKVDGKK